MRFIYPRISCVFLLTTCVILEGIRTGSVGREYIDLEKERKRMRGRGVARPYVRGVAIAGIEYKR